MSRSSLGHRRTTRSSEMPPESVTSVEYDVRTAPVSPAPVSPATGMEDVELTRKQIAALQRRIARGGDESVLGHYRSVIQELEASLVAAGKCYDTRQLTLPAPVKPRLVHVRRDSVTSNISTTSTRCPEVDEASGDDFVEISGSCDTELKDKAADLNLQSGAVGAAPASQMQVTPPYVASSRLCFAPAQTVQVSKPAFRVFWTPMPIDGTGRLVACSSSSMSAPLFAQLYWENSSCRPQPARGLENSRCGTVVVPDVHEPIIECWL